eukprot:353858-Chlamydomonas_euryale.AAC.1
MRRACVMMEGACLWRALTAQLLTLSALTPHIRGADQPRHPAGEARKPATSVCWEDRRSRSGAGLACVLVRVHARSCRSCMCPRSGACAVLQILHVSSLGCMRGLACTHRLHARDRRPLPCLRIWSYPYPVYEVPICRGKLGLHIKITWMGSS